VPRLSSTSPKFTSQTWFDRVGNFRRCAAWSTWPTTMAKCGSIRPRTTQTLYTSSNVHSYRSGHDALSGHD
jgi:hypothetical protein